MTQTDTAPGGNVRADIIVAMNQSLADTIVATGVAQRFHWNVKGMAFNGLHALFMEVYEDHFAAQDELAERIRAIGGHAGQSLADAAADAQVEDHDGRSDTAGMVRAMAQAERTLASSLLETGALAEKHGDAITHDLAIGRAAVHEKFAWMLDAHLE